MQRNAMCAGFTRTELTKRWVETLFLHLLRIDTRRPALSSCVISGSHGRVNVRVWRYAYVCTCSHSVKLASP